MRILSAPSADTIQAIPVTPFIVEIAAGASPVTGTLVTFTAANAAVGIPGGPFSGSWTSSTDSQGRLAVGVKLGSSTGSSRVVVSAVALSRVDTVEITVQPGAQARMCLTPPDTLMFIGDTLSVTATLGDRMCNATSGPVSVTKLSGPLSPTSAGFAGAGLGVGRVTASSAGFADTTTIQIIPDGQLVMTVGANAWLTRTDGTQSQQLGVVVPSAQERSVSWNPAGTRIVFAGNPGFRVFELASGTTLPTAWPGGLAGSNVLWPRFGPGGTIYYSSAAGGGNWDIRRANPDGTSAAIVIPDARFPGRDFFPDWAPDGSAMSVTSDWEEYSKFVIRVLDSSLTDTTTVNVEGTTPVWSPNGDLIAYWELGVVGVVSPDLIVNRSWNLGWEKGISWSPGSDMLVGRDATGRVTMVDIVSGANLTLSHLGTGRDAVAWRPINALAP